jgi:hypothetical protein
MKKRKSGVFGIFFDSNLVVEAIKKVKQEGYKDLIINSPVPSYEIDRALNAGVSPVRFFTLIGGILGALGGFALTIGTSISWPLITGGKPIISIPPFLIIVFELTILFAGIGALVGMLLSARLPKFSLDKRYDQRFSEDLFGIFVSCPKEKFKHIEEIFISIGAKGVYFEEG